MEGRSRPGRATYVDGGAGYRGGVTRDEVRRVTDASPPLSEQQRARRRRYFEIMGACLVLIVLAWTVVPLFSVRLAVAMSLVAAVLPPIAAIVANRRDD